MFFVRCKSKHGREKKIKKDPSFHGVKTVAQLTFFFFLFFQQTKSLVYILQDKEKNEGVLLSSSHLSGEII